PYANLILRTVAGDATIGFQLAKMAVSDHNTRMNDNQEPTSETSTEETNTSNRRASKIDTGEFDIAGALAAVSSLQDMTREADEETIADEDAPEDEASSEPTDDDAYDTAFDIQEFERVDEDDDAELPIADTDTVSDAMVQTETGVFPTPPLSTLHRGQLASVVPALLLMGVGAYLTFLVTTTESALSAPVIAAIAIGGLGAMLIMQWISSARWARGSLFIGLTLLLTGGTVAFLLLGDVLTLGAGYPLILTAIGLAFILTDVFVPSRQRVWVVGLLLGIGGLAGLLITGSLLPATVLDSLDVLVPVGLVILFILLIAPFFSRNAEPIDSEPDALSD
ncbi:MAG: hypothetical protein AAFN11_15810, partial [Chloroflexota bacterium]